MGWVREVKGPPHVIASCDGWPGTLVPGFISHTGLFVFTAVIRSCSPVVGRVAREFIPGSHIAFVALGRSPRHSKMKPGAARLRQSYAEARRPGPPVVLLAQAVWAWYDIQNFSIHVIGNISKHALSIQVILYQCFLD